MDILYSDENYNLEDFAFVLDGDEMMLKVLKESSLHDLDVEHEELFPMESYCMDQVPGGEYVVMLCPCEVIQCVRKCCRDGEAVNENNGRCIKVQNNVRDWFPEIREDQKISVKYYRLDNKLPECEKKLKYISKDLNKNILRKLYLLSNGSLQSADKKKMFPVNNYCSDFTTNNNQIVNYCEFAADNYLFRLYGLMFLVGAAALFLTVILTAVFPEMRKNMHTKMALAHNTMLLIGYTTTGIGQLMTGTLHTNTCKTIGFMIQFSMLAAFFWLNAMCIDITWVFSGFQLVSGNMQSHVKLIYFSLYAWGSTSLITITMAVAEFSTDTIKSIRPRFGEGMCFFNNNSAQWVFMYGPMSVLLSINFALFLYVVAKIVIVKHQTAILITTNSFSSTANKQNHVIYLKLFSLMGVTYLTEVLCWSIGGPTLYWLVPDIINLLRSIVIFIMFCCTRSVCNLLRAKVSGIGLSMGGTFRTSTIKDARSTTGTATSRLELDAVEKKIDEQEI